MRAWLALLGVIAGLMGAAGVALAAVGAHRSGNPNVITAAYFLLFHAPALLAVCVLARPAPGVPLLGAASLIAVGAILFAGDLALRALAEVVVWHMAAPTGGIVLILGWLGLALSAPFALSRDDL